MGLLIRKNNPSKKIYWVNLKVFKMVSIMRGVMGYSHYLIMKFLWFLNIYFYFIANLLNVLLFTN